MSVALSCQGVRVIRSGIPVLEDLSLTLRPGEITLLLGRNGAGKSTLIDVLCGLLTPDAGSVTRSAPQALGVQRQEPMLWKSLSVMENLGIFGALRTISPGQIQSRLTALAIAHLALRPVEKLSVGERSRVAFALATIHNPNDLLLDEPSASLDDAATDIVVREAQRLAAAGGSVLIATHDVNRFRRHATRALVLHTGRLIADSIADGGYEAVFSRYQEVNR